MKALKEVWRRAENSLCADCGKPGESPRAAGGRGRSRELGLVRSSSLVLAICLHRSLGQRGRRGIALSGYSLPLPGGELAREEEGDAATEEGQGHGSAR